MGTVDLKQLVKNKVWFSFYRKGNLYYNCTDGECVYQFSVPIEDTGDATFQAEDKGMLFMRYIRKAIESSELIFVKSV